MYDIWIVPQIFDQILHDRHGRWLGQIIADINGGIHDPFVQQTAGRVTLVHCHFDLSKCKIHCANGKIVLDRYKKFSYTLWILFADLRIVRTIAHPASSTHPSMTLPFVYRFARNRMSHWRWALMNRGNRCVLYAPPIEWLTREVRRRPRSTGGHQKWHRLQPIAIARISSFSIVPAIWNELALRRHAFESTRASLNRNEFRNKISTDDLYNRHH